MKRKYRRRDVHFYFDNLSPTQTLSFRTRVLVFSVKEFI